MKKKIISVFCLILIACTIFSACGKKEPQDLTNSKYLGTWKAVSGTIGSTTDPYEDECYLTLKPDGTAYFYADEEAASNCTWEETGKGIKLLGDTKMTFNEDGDALTTKIMGVTLRFELQ